MDTDKTIQIDYCVNPDKAEIFITDQGRGFKPEETADPRCGENLYKTDGRGLFLVRAYMNVVEFNEQGNRIHMVKYKQKTSTAQ